jgi:hypothetical protein
VSGVMLYKDALPRRDFVICNLTHPVAFPDISCVCLNSCWALPEGQTVHLLPSLERRSED